jgi:hypothetical protein
MTSNPNLEKLIIFASIGLPNKDYGIVFGISNLNHLQN